MHNAYGIPTDFSYTQWLSATPTHLCLPTTPTHLCLPTTPTHLCLSTIVPTHLIYLLTYTYPHYLPNDAYPLMPTHAYAYPRRRRVVPKAREHLVIIVMEDDGKWLG